MEQRRVIGDQTACEQPQFYLKNLWKAGAGGVVRELGEPRNEQANIRFLHGRSVVGLGVVTARARQRLFGSCPVGHGNDGAYGSDYLAGQITVPLDPGLYRLVFIVKDIGSGRTGTESTSVEVPTFQELTENQ
jgi:hypothetical protein